MDSNNPKWWYLILGNQNGPIEEDEIQKLIENGILKYDDLVWKEGMDAWMPLSNFFSTHLGKLDPPPLSIIKEPEITNNSVIVTDLKSQTKKGNLYVSFPGEWLLVDSSTKIFVDGNLHSTQSIKNGFNVEIPIISAKITLKLVLGGLRTTTYELNGLDISKDYSMRISYSSTMGKYSNEFTLSEIKHQPPSSQEANQDNNISPNQTINDLTPPITSLSIPEESKWYNNEGKLLLSFFIFFPAFFYGLTKTKLVKKRTKQLIIVALLFLASFVVGCYLYHISFAKKLGYVRVTSYSKWPGRRDVTCLAVILKSDPTKCFHIVEFPPDVEAAKTLDNPAFNHTQYSFLFSLDPRTDDTRRRTRVKEHEASGTEQGLADYSDLYDAIISGSKDEGLWEPTNLYYEIKDGDVYEKSSGEKLIDYLSQDEKIPALQNSSSNFKNQQEAPIMHSKDFNLQPEVKIFFYSQLSKVFDFEISEKKTIQESGNDIFNIDVSIIRKEDKKVIQHILYTPDKGLFEGFDSCAISYSTGYKKRGDDYDIVVADFNFDGREDFALQTGHAVNGTEFYDFYIQNKSGQFTKDEFLGSTVMGYIDTPNIQNKSFSVTARIGAGNISTIILSHDIATNKWNWKVLSERMEDGIRDEKDGKTGIWKTVEIRSKTTGKWEKVN